MPEPRQSNELISTMKMAKQKTNTDQYICRSNAGLPSHAAHFSSPFSARRREPRTRTATRALLDPIEIFGIPLKEGILQTYRNQMILVLALGNTDHGQIVSKGQVITACHRLCERLGIEVPKTLSFLCQRTKVPKRFVWAKRIGSINVYRLTRDGRRLIREVANGRINARYLSSMMEQQGKQWLGRWFRVQRPR